MKKLLLIVILAVLSLAPFQVDTWGDYIDFGRNRAVVYSAGGAQVSQFASIPDGNGGLYLFWGNPVSWPYNLNGEDWGVKQNCFAGQPMTWVSGYRLNNRSDGGPNTYYAVRTTKATITHGAQEYDITYSPCNPDDGQPHGQPYGYFYIFPGEYTVKVWGEIWDGPNPAKRFYWQAHFASYQPVYNPCNGQSGTGIVQRESWWDSAIGQPGAWGIGAGNAPYDGSGQPVDPAAIYGRRMTYGKLNTLIGTIESLDLSGGVTWAACASNAWNW